MRKTLTSLAVAVLVVIGAAAPVRASGAEVERHPMTRFHGCAPPPETPRRCVGGGDATLSYSWGSTVYLRARAIPAHQGIAQLWRVLPGAHQWFHLTDVTVGADGRMRWSWWTDEGDAYQDQPYRFQFRIPG